MLTVKVTFKDGTTDIKEVWDISEVPLTNVLEIKVIRDERKKAA